MFFQCFLSITPNTVCLYLLREPQGIIACCNPVPPLVRQQVNELHLLVQQAREMPLLKVSNDGRGYIMCIVFKLSVTVTHLLIRLNADALHRLRLQLRRTRGSHP